MTVTVLELRIIFVPVEAKLNKCRCIFGGGEGWEVGKKNHCIIILQFGLFFNNMVYYSFS